MKNAIRNTRYAIHAMQSSAQNNIAESNLVIPFYETVRFELDRVKQLINEQLFFSSRGRRNPNLDKLLESLRNRSGKMIRPGLVLLTGKYYNNITEKHISTAACIEMVHHATLLHDDVIDDGLKRRGKPTINSLWGNESAVLLGDFLLSHVFKLSSELDPKVIKVVADSSVRLCEGELRQIVQKDNWQISESEYISVITEKSAALFSNSCYLGAVLAQDDENQAKLFSDFGLNAGIAFQITDDLLDIVGDEKRTGKTVGKDADKHKPTLAVIHLLNSVNESAREELIETYLNDDNEKKEEFIEKLKNTGSLEYASKQAQKYVLKAIQALDLLPQNQTKHTLIETAKFMANRTS
ncbi:MAG: polyprenyl synthetase family protein [Sedimentisphaerales bacterium]|nr:polyprenyl synthetase family protein [Sedimentisphaerales bacterium]